jgi:hypothetical protein
VLDADPRRIKRVKIHPHVRLPAVTPRISLPDAGGAAEKA